MKNVSKARQMTKDYQQKRIYDEIRMRAEKGHYSAKIIFCVTEDIYAAKRALEYEGFVVTKLDSGDFLNVSWK